MSEATNRVLEAQLRRQKQHDKRQKEWETALKPTTIDGSGVLRQLGQQPLDNRQILPNTASLNRPVRPTAVPGGVVADWLPRVKKEEPEVKVIKKSNISVLLSVTLPSIQHSSIDRKMLVIYTGKEFFKLVEYEEWDWSEYNPQNDLTDLGEQSKISNTYAWQVPESSWIGHPGVRKTKSIASGSSSVTYGASSHQITTTAIAPTSTTRQSSIALFTLKKGFASTIYAVGSDGFIFANTTFRDYGNNPDIFQVFHGYGATASRSTYSIQSVMSNVEALMAEKRVEIIYLHTMKSDWFCWVRVREVDVRERFNLKITENEPYDPADLLNPLPDGVIPISSWWYGIHSDGRRFVYKRTKELNGSFVYEETIDDEDPTTSTSEIPIVDFLETPRSYLLNWDSLDDIAYPDFCSETWSLDSISNYKKDKQLITFPIVPPDTTEEFLVRSKTSLLDDGFSEKSRYIKTLSEEANCIVSSGSSRKIKLKPLDLEVLASLPETPVNPSYLTSSKLEVLAVSAFF